MASLYLYVCVCVRVSERVLFITFIGNNSRRHAVSKCSFNYNHADKFYTGPCSSYLQSVDSESY